MLTAIGAVTFAAAAAPRPRRLAALATGFAASLATGGFEQAPDAEIAGLIAATGALLFLFAPKYGWLAAVLGGMVAATAVRLLVLLGSPAWLGVVLAAAPAVLTVCLARRRPDFAPDLIRDDAMIGTCLLGLLVAVIPSVLDGWQAAANLNVSPAVDAGAIPVWAVSVIAASTLLGAAHALWSRR
jgi:hypothetical protein